MLGGSEKILETIFAFALVDENGISIAQAYGTMVGNDSCEIGVIINPDYRGKGYIVYPAIKVIEKCLDLNLKPVWSCNTENIASLKTALKLGFTIKRHYAFLKKINH